MIIIIFKVIARSVASMYAHTPVRTAEIWIFFFNFEKVFLSLNRDDTNPNPTLT